MIDVPTLRGTHMCIHPTYRDNHPCLCKRTRDHEYSAMLHGFKDEPTPDMTLFDM